MATQRDDIGSGSLGYCPRVFGRGSLKRAFPSSVAAVFGLASLLLVLDASATTLTIGDGVVVKYGSDASIVVRDGLHTGNYVSFTSLNDDNIGGQTQRSAGAPHSGDWRGVQILPTAAPSAIAINGLLLQYAGSSNAAALEIARFPYSLDALYIQSNLLGIRVLDATAAQLTNLTLIGNTVGMEASQFAVPNITQSQIEFNGQFGVLNLTPQTPVQALQNWWGSTSGPKDPIANPGGSGNPVSSGVNYGQFLLAGPLIACSIRTSDGNSTVTQPSVPLALYCVNTNGYRLSESTDFSASTFTSMNDSPPPTYVNYTFTGGTARTFMLYAQFRSRYDSNVTTTVALPTSITYTPPPPPPVVTITAPSAGTQISSDALITADVSTSITIASADFYVDANKIATVTAAPYQVTWSLAGVALGTHTLKVVATDSLGQIAQASESVTVISLDRPVIQNVTFQGAPLIDGANLTSVGTLAAQIIDSLTVSSVKLAIDGTNVSGGTLSGTQFSQSLTFNPFANGTHALTLTATNSAGNSSQFAISFTLAIPPPSTPVIRSPANGVVVTQPTVAVSGTTDVGTQVQLYLDGGAIGSLLTARTSGTFAGSVSLPTQATHQISAVASNSRGASAPSASVGVTYTPPPPTILITSPSKNATLKADTDISVAIIDTADITQVEFDIDGSAVARLTTTPYTWHWALSSANAGSHTIAVKATDSLANLLQASIPVSVQITPPPPPPIVTPYTGDLQSISPGVSYGEQPITINGSAVDRTLPSPNPVPNALLTLVLQVNGFKRQISVTTDDSGSFSYVFHPYSTDAGQYIVSIIHPQETTLTPQGFFTINRLGVSPGTYALQAARTVPAVVPVTVKASSGGGSSGVYLSADPEAQPSGNLPSGITIAAPSPVNIAAGGTAKVNVQFSADNSGGNTGTVILVAHASDSGTASRGTVAINYALSQPLPALFPQPTSVQTGVSQGKQVLASVKLQNKGLIAATNVVAQLLNSSGTGNAPAWMTLASGATPTTLDVGASETIQLNAAPTSDVSDGVYQFRIRVSADNAAGGDIPVSVSVTNSGLGSVMFNASDIYTATLDGSGNPIPGLAGATIKVQNQNVYTVVQSATTDANGNAEIDNLPVGFYTFVANAANHSSASGVLTILPGATVAQPVFLDYNAISIQWSVTETDIPDEYQVTLNATYQTQVPAPVVLIEPTSVNLPNLQVGETFTGEMTITNYGLVRADDVVFTPPASDANFRFEFMGEVPTSLQAHQRISLPYKITALASLPAGAAANLTQRAMSATSPMSAMLTMGGGMLRANSTTGSTCNTYSKPTSLTYDFSCANGTQTSGSASAVFARVSGQCTSSSGGSGGGGSGGGNDANGFGGPDYGCPAGQPLGSSPGCTPICISCMLKGGGFGGGGGGFGGGGPGGGPAGGGGGNPPPIFDGPQLQ